MEAEIAVKTGVWKITQNVETLTIDIFKYEHVVKEISADVRYTHEELYELLCREARRMREEV